MKNDLRTFRINRDVSSPLIWIRAAIPVEVFCATCRGHRISSSSVNRTEQIAFELICRECSGTQLAPIPLCELIDD